MMFLQRHQSGTFVSQMNTEAEILLYFKQIYPLEFFEHWDALCIFKLKTMFGTL